jgi:hypothetical protein
MYLFGEADGKSFLFQPIEDAGNNRPAFYLLKGSLDKKSRANAHIASRMCRYGFFVHFSS